MSNQRNSLSNFFPPYFRSVGSLFWFFILDPLYLKKKEPRLFFRLKGYLKNSRFWRACHFFLPAFSSKEKAEGASK